MVLPTGSEMNLLIISLVALFVGVLVMPWARRYPHLVAALDGFVLVSVAGLVLTHLLPHTIHEVGAWALVAVLLGLWVPWLFERGFVHSRSAGLFALIPLASLGLCVHAFLDGSALALPAVTDEAAHGSGHELALAVVFHRLPIGLAIGTLGARYMRLKLAIFVAVIVTLFTIAGYIVGLQAMPDASVRFLAIFQALMIGTLLHVIFAHPLHLQDGGKKGLPLAGALGALGGIGAMVVLGNSHAVEHGPGVWDTFIAFSLEASPALLIAFLGAGLLHGFMKPSSLLWIGRGSRAAQSVKGMALGLPLPICSCGALPVYAGLMERGLAPAAGLAFLVATPEIGLDAILISIPLLGPELTIARLVAAALVAFLVAMVVSRSMSARVASDTESDDPGPTRSIGQRLQTSVHYGFGELFEHIMPWIFFGLIIASVANPFLHQLALSEISPILQVIIAAVAGIPFYVCASGSTPIVAVFIYQGLSPGAAIAFLLTGPATNVTTFGVLSRLHGRSIAILFGLSMAIFACLAGWTTNLFLSQVTIPTIESGGEIHAHGFQSVCLGLLGLVTLAALFRRGIRNLLAQIHPAYGGHQHDHDH